MRVVLLCDVRGVGRRMEVREVSDGYARNFLIPRGLAALATRDALREKETFDAASRAASALRSRQLEDLERTPLCMTLKTGERGQVFDSITGARIEAELAQRGITQCKPRIPKPIREFGEHVIPLTCGFGVKGTVTILVQPQSEHRE